MKVIIDHVIRGVSWMLLAISCIFTGCGRETGNADRVFRYNEASGIATLDPAMAKNQSIMWAIHQVYNTLVETDPQLRISPSLAYRWDISGDRLVYTFHLRPDVFFHNDECFPGSKGRRMQAADVVYSFERITNPKTASSGAWIFNNRVDSTAAFTTIDDSTFQLKLQRPFTPILGLLSMQYCSIVPKEAVEQYGPDFRRHPVGTGPFRFNAWEEGQALVFLKNEQYFEKDSSGNSLPYLDAVKVSFYDSKATEFLLFRQHQLDFINDIDASFRDEVLTKKGVLKKEWTNKIILSKHPYLNTEYLGILVDSNNILVKDSPLRLKKIRQAINYGFDRDKMILYLRNSIGIPAHSGFIPAGLPGYDSNSVRGYRYEPQIAAALLKEAGYPNGKGLQPIKLLTIPIYADLGSYIARQL